jgi:ATP sulfurylase
MPHLAHEYSHAWALVAVVQAELHLVSMSIERGDIIVDLVARNHETLKFPFYTHKKHSLYLVYILVEVYNVTLVIRDKLGNFRNNSLLIRAVQ